MVDRYTSAVTGSQGNCRNPQYPHVKLSTKLLRVMLNDAVRSSVGMGEPQPTRSHSTQ